MRGFEEREKGASNRPPGSPVNGTTAIPWRTSRRKPSLLPVLERLRGLQEAWCPTAPCWDRERAHAALSGRPAGSFLAVRDTETSEPSLLCVSTGDEVADYPIRRTPAAFQLSQSHLGFSDLPQLVLFYSLTRDVLSVCLSIPSWVYSVTDQMDARLYQLEPESWLCMNSDPQNDHMTNMEPSLVMCSIQLTSGNGAVCVVNPLYLREHGDDWLARHPISAQLSTQLCAYRQRERRLSTARPWEGAGLRDQQRAFSLDQGLLTDSSSSSTESPAGLTRAQSDGGCPHQPTVTPASPPATIEGVVLRRPSRDSASSFSSTSSSGSILRAGSMGSLPSSAPSDTPRVTSSDMSSELQLPPGSMSPYRVSWIEDGVWLPPPRSRGSSLDPRRSMELDSLSVSSVDEPDSQDEPDTTRPSSPSTPSSASQRLADKVKNRLSAVGQAIGGLVCHNKRLALRVQELSERRGGAFAEAVRGFVEATLRGGAGAGASDPGGGARGLEFLQEVRQSLTSVKETMLDCPEVQTVLDSMADAPGEDIDSMVELALHKVALKPVSTHLYSSLQESRDQDGSLDSLRRNQQVLEVRSLEELEGSAGAGVPDALTLERMQQRWSRMHSAYSPGKKAEILLKVCKSIYESMSGNASPGAVFGADDFLPCLTWTLLRSDVVTLQLDTDYMMELLDPSQLQGERGYYLTSVYASLYYISSFRPRIAARQLSSEAQKSLNQWHRRRTLHCNQSRRNQSRRTIRRLSVHRERADRSRQDGKGDPPPTQTAVVPSGGAADSPAQPSEVSDGKTLEPVREEVVKAQGDNADDDDDVPSLFPPTQLTRKKTIRRTGGRSAEEKKKGVEPGGEEGTGAEEGERTHAPVHRGYHHSDVMWTTQISLGQP